MGKKHQSDAERAVILAENGGALKTQIDSLTEQKKEIDAELRTLPAGLVEGQEYVAEVQPRSTIDWKRVEEKLGKKATVKVPEHREFSQEKARLLLGADGLEEFRIPLTTAIIYRRRES